MLRQFVGAQLAESSSRVHIFRLLVSSKRFSFPIISNRKAAKTQFGSVFPENVGFFGQQLGVDVFHM